MERKDKNADFETYVDMYLFLFKSITTIVLLVFIGIQMLDNLSFACFIFFMAGVSIAVTIIGIRELLKKGITGKDVIEAVCRILFFPIWLVVSPAWRLIKSFFVGIKKKRRQTMELNRERYKRQCPFCKEICEGTPLVNLLCKCGAKYYYESDIWKDRKTGKEVKGDLWNLTERKQ